MGPSVMYLTGRAGYGYSTVQVRVDRLCDSSREYFYSAHAQYCARVRTLFMHVFLFAALHGTSHQPELYFITCLSLFRVCWPS